MRVGTSTGRASRSALFVFRLFVFRLSVRNCHVRMRRFEVELSPKPRRDGPQMIQALRVYLAVGLIGGLSFSQSAPNNTPAAAGSALPVLSDGSVLGEARVVYGK